MLRILARLAMPAGGWGGSEGDASAKAASSPQSGSSAAAASPHAAATASAQVPAATGAPGPPAAGGGVGTSGRHTNGGSSSSSRTYSISTSTSTTTTSNSRHAAQPPPLADGAIAVEHALIQLGAVHDGPHAGAGALGAAAAGGAGAGSVWQSRADASVLSGLHGLRASMSADEWATFSAGVRQAALAARSRTRIQQQQQQQQQGGRRQAAAVGRAAARHVDGGGGGGRGDHALAGRQRRPASKQLESAERLKDQQQLGGHRITQLRPYAPLGAPWGQMPDEGGLDAWMDAGDGTHTLPHTPCASPLGSGDAGDDCGAAERGGARAGAALPQAGVIPASSAVAPPPVAVAAPAAGRSGGWAGSGGRQHHQYRHLVFGGGGARCLAYTGALHTLRQLGLVGKLRSVSGASGGAVYAVLAALEFSAQEVLGIMGMLPGAEPMSWLALNRRLGLSDGEATFSVIEQAIAQRLGVEHRPTLGDVAAASGVDITIVATSLARRAPVYLTARSHPDMTVYDALRSSCAIPLLFSPVRAPGGDLLVDGCISDCTPLGGLLATPGVDLDEVLVLAVHDAAGLESGDLQGLLSGLVATFMQAGWHFTQERGLDLINLWPAVAGVNPLQFRLPPEQARDVTAAAQALAEAFAVEAMEAREAAAAGSGQGAGQAPERGAGELVAAAGGSGGEEVGEAGVDAAGGGGAHEVGRRAYVASRRRGVYGTIGILGSWAEGSMVDSWEEGSELDGVGGAGWSGTQPGLQADAPGSGAAMKPESNEGDETHAAAAAAAAAAVTAAAAAAHQRRGGHLRGYGHAGYGCYVPELDAAASIRRAAAAMLGSMNEDWEGAPFEAAAWGGALDGGLLPPASVPEELAPVVAASVEALTGISAAHVLSLPCDSVDSAADDPPRAMRVGLLSGAFPSTEIDWACHSWEKCEPITHHDSAQAGEANTSEGSWVEVHSDVHP